MSTNGKPNGSEPEDKAASSGYTITLKGRIEGRKKIQPDSGNDFIRTVIVTPAKDSYSHPSTWAVNSDAPLGNDGSEVTVACDLRPASRKKDGETYYNIQLWQVI